MGQHVHLGLTRIYDGLREPPTPAPAPAVAPAPAPSPTEGNSNGVTTMTVPITKVSCAPGYIYQGTFPTGRCVWVGPGPEPRRPTGAPEGPRVIRTTEVTQPTTVVVEPPPAGLSWFEQEWIAGVKNKWLAVGFGILLLWQMGDKQ